MHEEAVGLVKLKLNAHYTPALGAGTGMNACAQLCIDGTRWKKHVCNFMHHVMCPIEGMIAHATHTSTVGSLLTGVAQRT